MSRYKLKVLLMNEQGPQKLSSKINKTVKNVPIDPQTTVIWSKKLNVT